LNIPEDLYYSREHEWVKVEDNVGTIGITRHAVDELGDIVFVELPEVGDKVKQFESFGVIESVKTVSDLFAPISGEVIEINKNLLQEIEGEENDDFHPEYINEDPYGSGWMLKVKMDDEGELDNLLDADDYGALIEE